MKRPVPGDEVPMLAMRVTQRLIDDYARASGDFNPIHVDPAYARDGPYGRTIAHGLMLLALVARMLNQWSDGAFDDSGELDVAFVAPVFVDDMLELSGIVEEIVERDGAPCARIRLVCMASGRQVLAGTAAQPLAPERRRKQP